MAGRFGGQGPRASWGSLQHSSNQLACQQLAHSHSKPLPLTMFHALQGTGLDPTATDCGVRSCVVFASAFLFCLLFFFFFFFLWCGGGVLLFSFSSAVVSCFFRFCFAVV